MYVNKEDVIRETANCFAGGSNDSLTNTIVNMVEEIVNKVPEADVQPTRYTTNESGMSHHDRFICQTCGIALQNCKRVVPNASEENMFDYEYEFKFCPECGAKITTH